MKAVLTLLLFLCCLPFNSATAQSTVSQFRSLDDVFDFVRPSKTFSTRGGDLEIRCVGRGEGESMLMYYRNKFLSEVGWENPNTAAKGSYARLAVRTDRYQVTVILHLPDGKHSKPYLYFEPLPTSTNRQLATALNRGARINMPISNGWLKFDPIVDGDYATLSFQPSSSEPTPYYYDMKEGSYNYSESYDIVTNPDSEPVLQNGTLYAFIAQHLKYPIDAAEDGIQGRVVIKVIVNEDGSVSNPVITRKVSPSLDREAMRVVKMLPRFIPAKKNGYPCKAELEIPFTFKIQ